MDDAEAITQLVARALAEDLGAGDLTAETLVPPGSRGRASISQKAPGVVFGLEIAREVMRQSGVERFEAETIEGEWRDEVPTLVATATGPAASLLAAERTALNFLGHLSGIATITARFVAAVADTAARILDTRKTTPGLRTLEKRAVAAAGGVNHRMGLYDAILIKENHIAFAGGLEPALKSALATGRTIEVECRDLDEVARAIAAGAGRILLDNMDAEQIREAVGLRAGVDQPQFEASGGISLENVREVAETGVEYISVGALTHSAPALDLSMLIEPDGEAGAG